LVCAGKAPAIWTNVELHFARHVSDWAHSSSARGDGGGQRSRGAEGYGLNYHGAGRAVLDGEAVAVSVDPNNITAIASLGKVVVVAVAIEVDGVCVKAV
jgi:hypothetical protein